MPPVWRRAAAEYPVTRVHVCVFASTDHLRGKARTYEAVKAAVLAAGRFSVFEATATPRDAQLFSRFQGDPEVEVTPLAFPWVGVRRKADP